MLLDIPDIKGPEKETLFIIGNGFDRAHGIESSYWHFHDWLLKNGHQSFVKAIEGMYNEENRKRFSDDEVRPSLLWTDFENALGKIDAWSVRQMLEEENENIVQRRDLQKFAIQKIKKTVDNVSILMKEWAGSIDISQAQSLFNLSKESQYLTFNYTLTLEKCYHIGDSHICHIHKKVKDNDNKTDMGDENLVVGCASEVRRDVFGNLNERQLDRKVNAELNRFNKPSDDLIDENTSFFESLHSITRVVVIGHSVSDIDMPYLNHVKESVSKDAHWHFSAFNEKDYENIKEFLYEDTTVDYVLAQNIHYIFNVSLMSEDEKTKEKESVGDNVMPDNGRPKKKSKEQRKAERLYAALHSKTD